MCKSHNPRVIDKCMKTFIENLKIFDINVKACCCGHGRYPMTIVVETGGDYFDLVSGAEIPRIKRYYEKDKKGYYYIPEVLEWRK